MWNHTSILTIRVDSGQNEATIAAVIKASVIVDISISLMGFRSDKQQPRSVVLVFV